MPCAPGQLVPQGPGVEPQYQGCAIGGATPGSSIVSGDGYLATQFNYSRDNLWRNFGVVIALAVFYIFVTVVATEMMSFAGGGGGALVFSKLTGPTAKDKKAESPNAGSGDSSEHSPEPALTKTTSKGETLRRGLTRASTKGGEARKAKTQDEVLQELTRSESVFTWSNLSLELPTPFGPKKLLNDVSGFAKPGVMVALMGASGAGKTTLLNTLSQRMPFGTITGDMLVDGRPLGVEFQRNTGNLQCP